MDQTCGEEIAKALSHGFGCLVALIAASARNLLASFSLTANVSSGCTDSAFCNWTQITRVAAAGTQPCSRELRGTDASRKSIWSATMRRPRRIMSSCRLGT